MERVLFAPREPTPLPPDVSEDSTAYSPWASLREQTRANVAIRRDPPHLRLVMLCLGPAPGPALGRTLRSLAAQTSPGWTLELTAADTESTGSHVQTCLPRRLRQKVTVLPASRGAGAADQLTESLRNAGGPVALIHPGDVWAPDAAALLANAVSPGTVAYADEDVVDAGGSYLAPRLKPDYSPDFLLSTAYLGRPMTLGADVVRRLPALVAEGGAALEHDLALAACRVADAVVHVPEVLCHRSIPAERPTSLAQVTEALRRDGEMASVECDETEGVYHVRRAPSDALVSVLIPFRDQPRFLRTCLDSVSATTRDDRVEFVLIDNGSTDPEMLTLLERVATRPDVTLLTDGRPFNWARLNNNGAAVATGDVLLFLNDDIEALEEGWLSILTAHALRPDVGVAGARLLYPGGRLQHCGIVVGLGGAAGHPLAGLPPHGSGYLHMASATRECSAVTGACLATRRNVFAELGGFDESLGVDLNDVDYCLRAGRAGYRTIHDGGARLVHYESPSRGTAGGAGDIMKFVERWKRYISEGDPYLNAHLTRADPSCGLATSEEAEVWTQWYSALKTA